MNARISATKTLAAWVDDAVAVQDACNLSGVVHAFSRFMSDCCENGLDTDQRNNHPVSRLFADKIASLTNTQSIASPIESEISDAYRWAFSVNRGDVAATWSVPLGVEVAA